jgi:hypothetical protein
MVAPGGPVAHGPAPSYTPPAWGTGGRPGSGGSFPFGQSSNPYSLSSFTPAGFTAPDFDPVSGGSRYAYQYDPSTGQGSFINSMGQPMSYSSF